jgi:DNA-directed RNA polymerase specialized sigma24 family protein
MEEQHAVVLEFPTTHWSMIARAGTQSDEGWREALERLLRAYLPALRSYLCRGRRLSPDLADDVLQSFLTSKILEGHLISRADPTRGRFRSFLITALNNFRASLIRSEAALHRNPGSAAVPLEASGVDVAAADPTPGEAFDVEWARHVLDQAVEKMRAGCQSSGRPDIWGVFEARVLRPALDQAEPTDYSHLVERFGFRSPTQASNVLVTATRMFGRALRSVVGEYEETAEGIDREIAELRSVLAGSGAGGRVAQRT